MNFQEFINMISEKMKECLGEKYQIEIHQVRKNNDILLNGLTIHSEQTNVVPTIYLEPFYELYKEKESIEEIVCKIKSIYEKNLPQKNLNMDFFCDFEKVKDRIVYRLIHADRNIELLKDVPHIPFWDLAICFYYAFWSEELGEGMILIHTNHMENWKVNCRQLMQLAEVNTPRVFPFAFYGINEMIKQLLPEDEHYDRKEEDLYVLTNRQKINGATVILYPRVLAFVADLLKDDFYIIPSSVHEVLILKRERVKDLEHTGKSLHELIREVNFCHLSGEDVLSDYPYFYDRLECKLVQVI